MPKPTPGARSPLVTAAERLEQELSRYEQLADELTKLRLDTEKNLARGARAVQEAAELQDAFMEHVKALGAAVEATGARQKAQLERMAEAAQRLGERATAFQELMARFAELMQSARSVNTEVASIAPKATPDAPPGEVLGALGAVAVKVDALIANVTDLVHSAKERDFPDVVREADALRQQMSAARNRLMLAQRKLAERAPS